MYEIKILLRKLIGNCLEKNVQNYIKKNLKHKLFYKRYEIHEFFQIFSLVNFREHL